MEFTGERYVPEIHGNIELEHVHRYLQASEIAIGKDVLDIASGEGFGSEMLVRKAKKVIGIDVSNEAVNHARKRYKKENLEFMVGNCADIPLPDSSVDLVVSFETIEHHDQHEEMMKEIKRVLRPNGILLISSPDKYNYSIEPGYTNPFHIKELYQHEFKQLLGNYFTNISYFGQRIVYASAIFSELLPTQLASYLNEKEIIKTIPGVSRPTYNIALATDSQLPEIISSIFEQSFDDSETVQSWRGIVSERDNSIHSLTSQVAERDKAIQSLTSQVAERDKAIQSLTSQVAERDRTTQRLAAQVAERDQIIQLLNTQVAELNLSIQLLNTENVMFALSESWRFTRPLRKIMQFVRGKKND